MINPISFYIVYLGNFSDPEEVNNTGQQNLTFFFVPRTSIDELSSTFYIEFRYIYRIFLSDRVSKMQRNLNVQNNPLLAHETGRNFSLKCRDV